MVYTWANRTLFAILMASAGAVASAADWTQFRGPQGDGCAEAGRLPTRWGGFLRAPVWQTWVPGSGWSSPIVVGQRIWLTVAEQTALTETERGSKFQQNPHGTRDFQVHGPVSLLAVEFDARNGNLLRRIELFTCENPPPIHIYNSYASPTPVTDGRQLYCHFGSLGTAALEMQSGRIIWKKHFAIDDITGPGNSPVLCDDRLVLSCDGGDEQFVVALDKDTGEIAWRSPRPPIDAETGNHKRAFSTPLLIEHEGRQQIIAPGAQWVVAYDPKDGHEIWRVNFGSGHAVVPRPIFHNGIVYVCTGYPDHDLWAIRVDGSGDVTDSHVVWKYTRQAPEIASPVVCEGRLYFVTAVGVATCLDAEAGTILWQRRLGGSYGASPLAADGKLYFTNQAGVTTVLQPGPDYREIARNELFGETLASFAVAGDTLIIRAGGMLYCVGENAESDKPSAFTAQP